MGPFSQNSNPEFEQQEELIEDNLFDILDNNHNNTSIWPIDDEIDEDSKNDIQYLRTQVANIDDENSKDSRVHHYFSVTDESNSDSNNLNNIDQ